MWIDAIYAKVCKDGRIVSVAVIVKVGAIADRHHFGRGMEIDSTKTVTFRTAFLAKLTRHGLRGIKLTILDSHKIIEASMAKVMNAVQKRRRV